MGKHESGQDKTGIDRDRMPSGAHRERHVPSPASPLIRQLRIRRMNLGHTLQEVAGRAGVSVSTLIGWENGSHLPSLEMLMRWTAAVWARLNVVPDYQQWREAQSDGTESTGVPAA